MNIIQLLFTVILIHHIKHKIMTIRNSCLLSFFYPIVVHSYTIKKYVILSKVFNYILQPAYSHCFYDYLTIVLN